MTTVFFKKERFNRFLSYLSANKNPTSIEVNQGSNDHATILLPKVISSKISFIFETPLRPNNRLGEDRGSKNKWGLKY